MKIKIYKLIAVKQFNNVKAEDQELKDKGEEIYLFLSYENILKSKIFYNLFYII